MTFIEETLNTYNNSLAANQPAKKAIQNEAILEQKVSAQLFPVKPNTETDLEVWRDTVDRRKI